MDFSALVVYVGQKVLLLLVHTCCTVPVGVALSPQPVNINIKNNVELPGCLDWHHLRTALCPCEICLNVLFMFPLSICPVFFLLSAPCLHCVCLPPVCPLIASLSPVCPLSVSPPVCLSTSVSPVSVRTAWSSWSATARPWRKQFSSPAATTSLRSPGAPSSSSAQTRPPTR